MRARSPLAAGRSRRTRADGGRISRPPGASSAKQHPHRQPITARRRKLPWRDRGAAAPSRALIQAERTCFCQRGIGTAWGKAPSPPLALHDRRVAARCMGATSRRRAPVPRIVPAHGNPACRKARQRAWRRARDSAETPSIAAGRAKTPPIMGKENPPPSAISGGERAGTTRAQTNQGVPHPRAHP